MSIFSRRQRRPEPQSEREEVLVYRIEVEIALLPGRMKADFMAAARRAGFQVVNDGYRLTVPGLMCDQACTLRDGFLDLGIHSSIGITEQVKPVRGPSFTWDMSSEEMREEIERWK